MMMMMMMVMLITIISIIMVMMMMVTIIIIMAMMVIMVLMVMMMMIIIIVRRFLTQAINLFCAHLILKSISFTISGDLAILHRSISVPKGCVDKSRWDLICHLRAALRAALAVPELPRSGWLRGRAGTLLFDSPVETAVRNLFGAVPCGQSSEVARPDESHTSVESLAANLVDLAALDCQDGPVAFWPLAAWDELNRRRKIAFDAPPAKRAKLSGTATASTALGCEVVLLMPSLLGPPWTRAHIASVGPMQYYLPNGMSLYFAHQGISWMCSGPAPGEFTPTAPARLLVHVPMLASRRRGKLRPRRRRRWAEWTDPSAKWDWALDRLQGTLRWFPSLTTQCWQRRP